MFMIGSLKGITAALGDDRALIEVQGVGYLVHAGARTLARLAEAAPAHLFIETQLREDSLKLYGFPSDTERAWFVRLQDIPGVGAKVALAVLDTLTPGQLMQAAELEDKASVARANGVGPKLAARIVQELKGRSPPQGLMGASGRSLAGETDGNGAFTPPSQEAGTEEARREGLGDMALRNQAISALVNLGISQPEAMRSVALAYRSFADDPPVSALVKAALKEVGR
jgi:holliday junction DNA helicase RuvA